MKCQCYLQLLLCLVLLQCAVYADQLQRHPRPLVFKSWPPRSQSIRNGPGMLLQLRGSSSSNIVSRIPAPNMFIKSQNPIHLAMPSRLSNRPLKASPSTHIYFKSGPPPGNSFKKPYSAALTSPAAIKFSSPGHKTAIKFKSAPPVPLKSKPEFIYEKVTVPKFSEPIIGTDAAIHQIAAPNLSLTQLDNDLAKVPAQAFALEKPVPTTTQFHQYQVRENTNDVTFKNAFTGQKTYFAPDNDPTLKTPSITLNHDPLLNTPSDGNLKPSDVLYHQNIDFNASPLVQQHFAVDPFNFPVTALPQLQQYHLQQNAMLQQGMPLAAYNPTYLVMQSNNLLGQHQQHFQTPLFNPAHGYVDTSYSSQPQHVTPDYGQNHEVASIGQIYSAQKDLYHQLQNVPTSTFAPSTASGYYTDIASASQSQNIPAVTHLEPKPIDSNYQYSQNFFDYSDDRFTPSDVHNFLNYEDAYQRQVENDLILQEAHEKLKGKMEFQKQQEAAAFGLHQLALGEKFNPLTLNPIVVPDEEFKKRNDEDASEDSYEDIEYENETKTTTDKPVTATS